MDLERLEDGSFELVREEFYLGSIINAVVSQAMFLLRERSLQLIRDIPEEIKSIAVFGDQTRTQQLLAEFLLSIIRMACPGEGLPPELVRDMFHSSRWTSPEGLGLSVCRKILKLMNGEVQYIRESERSYFLIILELPVPPLSTASGDMMLMMT
uniref:Histidine kinase domain-containing protein n=1 Tax=Brassica campestris TaxID=3711 RepID=M4CBS0_BRACM